MMSRNFLSPLGTLFDQLPYRNISAMSSETWTTHALYSACFLIISVPFWHENVVQDYVQFILRSRAHVEQRWLEQVIFLLRLT
jgi:hypothetical protein